MKAILKFFSVDGVNKPFATIQEFSKFDKIKVDNLSSFINGTIINITGSLLEVDLGWTSTQTKVSSDCYKVIGEITPEGSKMINNSKGFYHDGMEIEVEEELINYGFAGKHPTGNYKVKCNCCETYK